MNYRPVPSSTVYQSAMFRRPEVEEAFEKLDKLPDPRVRDAARHGLVALVSMVGDIKQGIDDLHSDIDRVREEIGSLSDRVDKEIAGRSA